MGTRVFRDVDYNEYLRVSKALSVCAPDVEIQLISRDDMLFLLGHSSYIPCTFQVTLTDEQIENIHGVHFNANKANIEIQRYTQHLNAEVDKQQAFEGEKKKVKEYLIRSYNDKPESASGIEYVNKDVFDGKGDKDLILRILRDLEADGVIESMNFYGTEEFAIFKLKRTY